MGFGGDKSLEGEKKEGLGTWKKAGKQEEGLCVWAWGTEGKGRSSLYIAVRPQTNMQFNNKIIK
jgi:hypothetical protein